ncbi:MAG: hypothetical protein MJ099_05840, partial [Clostridia bacterium]|nr:hypothetical protein [Clostridia bacterium]
MHRFSLLIRFTAIALSVLLLLLVTFYPVYTRGELIVMDAKTHLGDKYVLSKAGENDTFDCSGLIMYCFSRYGFIFEHSAELIGCA